MMKPLLNYLILKYLEECTAVDEDVILKLKESLERQFTFGKLNFTLFQDGRTKERPVTYKDLAKRYRGHPSDYLEQLFENETLKIDRTNVKNSNHVLARKHIQLRGHLRELEKKYLELNHRIQVLKLGKGRSESPNSDKQQNYTRRISNGKSIDILRTKKLITKEEIETSKLEINKIWKQLRKQQPPFLQAMQLSRFRLDDAWYYSKLMIIKKIKGHMNNVYCVKFDSSGRWIVTGSDDHLVKLWNARTGLLRCTFRGHKGYVCDIAISETSKLLATSSLDTTVRLWEMLTGRPLIVLTSHVKNVGPIRFDNQLLISASDDGTCCIWDTEKIVEEINNTRDGGGCRNRIFRQNNAQNREQENEQSAEGLSAQELAQAGFSTEFIATASGANRVSEEATAASIPREGRIPLVLPHLDMNAKRVDVSCLSLRKGGHFIVTGSDDGTGRIWNIERNISSRCRSTPAAITMPDLVSGSYVDGSCRLVCLLRGHCSPITHVSWSNDGTQVLSGSVKDGTVRIWYWPKSDKFDEFDLWRTPHHRVLSLHAPTLTAGTSFGSGSGRAAIPNIPQIGRRQGKLPTLDACSWNADDSRVVTMQSIPINLSNAQQESAHLNPEIFSDQQVRVWNPRNGQVLHTLRAHRRPGYCITVHPTNPDIALTIAHDGLLCVWDIHKGILIKKILVPSIYGPVFLLDAVFAPFGKSPVDILVSDSYGRLILFGTDSDAFNASPPEQFYENDYAELVYDQNMNVLDVQTSLATHMIPKHPLCDSQMTVYPIQPPPVKEKEGSYLTTKLWSRRRVIENTKRMSAMVKEVEKTIMNKESNMMSSLHETLERMDRRIQEQVNQQTRSSSQGNLQFSSRVTTRNRPSRGGMLAIERERLERAATNRDMRIEARSSSDSDSTAEEQVPTRRRRAARRAQGRIRRVQELDNTYRSGSDDDDQYTDEESDASESDSLFENKENLIPIRRSSRARRITQRLDYTSSLDDLSDGANSDSRSHERGDSRRNQINRNFSRRSRASRDDSSNRIAQPEFNREWLNRTFPAGPALGEGYVPQLGDVVVYCVQGHHEYLKWFPIHEAPPWRTNNWRVPDWPFVLCRIKNLRYDFPIHKGSKVIIACIQFTIIAVPSQSGSELWVPQRGSRHTPLKQFSIVLQQHQLSEFLILKERFEAGLKLDLNIGDEVHALFLGDENRDELYYGSIVDKRDADPKQWPGSPWERIIVKWTYRIIDNQQVSYSGDADPMSPWDLAQANLSDGDIPWKAPLVENNKCKPEFTKSLLRRLESISEEEHCAKPFIDPVPVERVPGYGNIVPLPMDLSTVIERLKNSYYRHADAVVHDLGLIEENCLKYNVEDCEISHLAQDLLALLFQAIDASLKEVNISPDTIEHMDELRKKLKHVQSEGNRETVSNGLSPDEKALEDKDGPDDEDKSQESVVPISHRLRSALEDKTYENVQMRRKRVSRVKPIYHKVAKNMETRSRKRRRVETLVGTDENLEMSRNTRYSTREARREKVETRRSKRRTHPIKNSSYHESSGEEMNDADKHSDFSEEAGSDGSLYVSD